MCWQAVLRVACCSEESWSETRLRDCYLYRQHGRAPAWQESTPMGQLGPAIWSWGHPSTGKTLLMVHKPTGFDHHRQSQMLQVGSGRPRHGQWWTRPMSGLLVSSWPWHAISLWEDVAQWEPWEVGALEYFASLSSSTIQTLLRLAQSSKRVMLLLLDFLQHNQIVHRELSAAASAIGWVLLLLELSFDLLAAKVPSKSQLSGKHETSPLFLPTLNPAHQKWLPASGLQLNAIVFDKCEFWCSKKKLESYAFLCFLLLNWSVGR